MALADDLHHLSRELHELIENPDRHSRDEMTFWLVATSEFLRELSRYVGEHPDFSALHREMEPPKDDATPPPSSTRRARPASPRQTRFAV